MHALPLPARRRRISPALAIPFALTLACTGSLAATTALPTFHLTDLGTLGGATSQSYDLNKSGNVTGSSLRADGSTGAFVASHGAMTDIGTLGGTKTIGRDIDTAGRVVGSSNVAGDTAQHAFLWAGGTMTDLGTFGGVFSIATSIADDGLIVGHATDVAGATHAFAWRNATMTDLGMLPGTTNSESFDSNTSGTIVGTSTDGFAFRCTQFASGTAPVEVAGLGGSFCVLHGINDAGDILGYGTLPDNVTQHAFVIHAGHLTDLGSLGGTAWAWNINRHGLVVGYSGLAGNAVQHAFIASTARGMTDLNALLDPVSGAGWTVTSAWGITNNGRISGTATLGGVAHAVLLAPLP